MTVAAASSRRSRVLVESGACSATLIMAIIIPGRGAVQRPAIQAEERNMSQAPPHEKVAHSLPTVEEFQDKIAELASELQVPGVAAGIYLNGEETIAVHGVTSIENPLAVTEETLFQFGSTGKTFTATAIMRLVEQGKVDLDAPVRQYIPELKLKDDDVAQRVTVLQLLNHTAGWAGDLMEDVGDGDDALDKYLGKMADLEQVSPLGRSVSYNNASLSVAGLIISRVTGK